MSESKSGFKISWKSWFALLAVVGVIFFVGIVSYGDYLHIAQATEATTLMGGFKEPLVEHFQKNGKWPDTLEQFGGTTTSKIVQSIAITKGAGGTGEIELTTKMRSRAEGVDRRVAGMSFLLVSTDGGKRWICRPSSTMEPKNLPKDCGN